MMVTFKAARKSVLPQNTFVAFGTEGRGGFCLKRNQLACVIAMDTNKSYRGIYRELKGAGEVAVGDFHFVHGTVGGVTGFWAF